MNFYINWFVILLVCNFDVYFVVVSGKWMIEGKDKGMCGKKWNIYFCNKFIGKCKFIVLFYYNGWYIVKIFYWFFMWWSNI